jgi:O-antigen/teichoic acid export membrane protein
LKLPLKDIIHRKFSQGSVRSVKAKRNIVGLFVLRAVTVVVNFILVPLALNYLNPTRYGIWLTLSSIVGWISMLDIGLGNGLRNKFAEALSHDNIELARAYVSTTYVFVTLIAVAAILLFYAVNPFLQWHAILNTPAEMEQELQALATAVVTLFSVRLVFNLISTILFANQRPATATMIEVLVSIFSLGAVYGLTRTTASSLYWLGFSISFLSAAVPLAANFWFFGRSYRSVAPSFRYVDRRHARSLMGLGIQFFLLQIAGVIIFASSNVIIAQLFGPAEVTPFNIAFRYYGVAGTVFTILLTPFWSAYTEAYAKGDTQWIRLSIRKLKSAWLVLLAALVIMTVFARPVYALWVGGNIEVSSLLSIGMAVYIAIVAWSNIFAYFMNGTGKVRLQVWVSIIVSIVVIPLSIALAHTHGWKGAGVIFAICICLFPSCFLWPIQMKKLITGTAEGIWAK